MSLLFKNFRVHQVFGANTDVGKTVLTSALVRASALSEGSVFYLKPVSAGPPPGDECHIKRHAGPRERVVHTNCLFHFQEPVSPHLAAKLALEHSENQVQIPSNELLLSSIADHVRKCASEASKNACMYVETAGGVHSPTPSGPTQLDSYRPLFFPVILVGDPKLGGISSTISSYESLLLRGYIIDAILLFRDKFYRNFEYLTSYFAERGIHITAFDPPPPRETNTQHDFTSTESYYNSIVPSSRSGSIFDVLRHLDACHSHRLQELDSMARRTLDSIWWPFVQHGLVEDESDVTVIDSAYSDFFNVYNSRHKNSHNSVLEPQFDGSASWWTQTLGHAHPSLSLAAARAAGRYGHVMLPQASNMPALKLAERLVNDGPGKGWASRVYFSDNGSTGMEIALKMALRAYSSRQGNALDAIAKKNLGVVGLKGGYHGDTIGAMDACEEGVFTCEWHSAKGYWFEPPAVSIQKGRVVVNLPPAIAADTQLETLSIVSDSLSWVYDIPSRLNTPLAGVYREFIQRRLRNLQKDGGCKLAALVLEPLVLGAGGMIFVDPLFQRVMIDVVRGSENTSQSGWSGLPVIFDEVFVGLYRLGLQSSAPLLGVQPDISVYAKILSGGLVPMAATLASDAIFDVFVSKDKTAALLHGHSYTAHPVGCEVANETLDIIEKLTTSESWKDAQRKWAHGPAEPTVWSLWDPHFVNSLSCMEGVAEVMTLGTVLALKVADDHGGYGSNTARTVLASIKEAVHSKMVSSGPEGSQSRDIHDETMSPGPNGSPFGIHFRTLGNVAYFMTSLNTSPATIRLVEDKIRSALLGST